MLASITMFTEIHSVLIKKLSYKVDYISFLSTNGKSSWFIHMNKQNVSIMQ